MSDRSYRRLTRWAVFAAFTLPTVLVGAGRPDGNVWLIAFAAWLLLLLAIGPYQADVALNPALDESDRRHWRIALFLFPWSMALYWHRHVRR